MKRCICCGILKDETKEFFQFRSDIGKLRNTCRECNNKRQKKKYSIDNSRNIKLKTEREILLSKGFIRCFDCGGIMTLDKFNNHPNGFGGKKTHCKSCQKIRKAKSIENNSDKFVSQQKKWQITRRLKNYGLTFEQYEAIMLKQNSKCKICRTEVDIKTVAIDHCHTNGHIRGFLCGTCNSGLGFFKDNTDYLRNAIKYLNDNGEEINLVAITTGTQNP